MSKKTIILLAEDNPQIKEMLKEFLEDNGFAVAATDNLKDAKKIIHHIINKPRIVITDMEYFEEKGGKENNNAGNELAEAAHKKGLPVIGMTAREDKNFNEKHVYKQLKKPINLMELKTIIDEIILEREEKKKKILIVEDNKTLLEQMVRFLGRFFEVMTATTLEEAEKKAKKADLIITDGVYPREGVSLDAQGETTTYSGNILAEKYHKIKKIIGISGNPNGFKKEYFDMRLVKGIEPNELKEKIDKLLFKK